MLKDKTILITGGSGSFGTRFVEFLLSLGDDGPRKIIIYSRDPQKHHEMAARFTGKPYDTVYAGKLRFWVGDVRNLDKLKLTFASGIDYVVHAAALKHIDTCEYNADECMSINTEGTRNVVRAAIRNGIRRVVLLSTDKAVDACTLYGKSKAAAEDIFLSGNFHEPIFSVVRYGNVMGSAGSVLPYFKSLLASGATELPVTDRRMTRFWYTFDRAIDLVLSALAGRPGMIYVGTAPSFYILGLVEALGAGVRETGIRPKEKLHEILVSRNEVDRAYRDGEIIKVYPAWHYHKGMEYKVIGERLEEEYSSVNNKRWLTVEEMKRMADESL
jgi:UDP-N-acetylglucosamine 4,6-dehydratase